MNVSIGIVLYCSQCPRAVDLYFVADGRFRLPWTFPNVGAARRACPRRCFCEERWRREGEMRYTVAARGGRSACQAGTPRAAFLKQAITRTCTRS